MATAIGRRPRGFFIPYRHAADVMPIDYPHVAKRLKSARGEIERHVDKVQSHAGELTRFGGAPPAPRFEQDWFPRLDMAMAYAVVRAHRPRRIVEIGSGHSTRVLARAAADNDDACELLCVDPAPRAAIAGLNVRHRPALLSDDDEEIVAALGRNDVLFIDSSHVAMPGSDVDRLFNRVLPRLASGCIVHVHDIFLPWAYPVVWRWRGYNEQLLLACLLQGNAFDILFASQWALSDPQLMARAPVVATLPLLDGAMETSFWLRKR
ncbi:MAG: class I SAM-dependent methyltransferase [Geminicoccaceae bacterium]|nr:class I SAM-dependent methyltransferase [Geminicoccaceae bacterium]